MDNLEESYQCFVSSAQIPYSDCPWIHALTLCDCSNVVAMVSQHNPRTVDKCYRLTCNYIFDMARFMNISFVNAGFNLADVGTKLLSNLAIWKNFMRSNLFRIGFMSRKDFQANRDLFASSTGVEEKGIRENL